MSKPQRECRTPFRQAAMCIVRGGSCDRPKPPRGAKGSLWCLPRRLVVWWYPTTRESSVGEAKRRKQIMAAAGFELRRAYNTELRHIETARVLPMTARQTTNANIADRQRVLRGDPDASVAVPCAGSLTCCWAKYIEVEPELERPEDLAVLNVAPNPDKGGFMLAKRHGRRVRSPGRRARVHCLRTPTAGMPTVRLPPVCDHRRGGQSTSVRFGCLPRPRLTRRLLLKSCAAPASITSTSNQFVRRARQLDRGVPCRDQEVSWHRDRR